MAPDSAIGIKCRRACATAGRISTRAGCEIANANTALRKKLATVSVTMARPIGIRTGPRSTLNDLPCRVWALRSSIASQIHIAGRICTSVSRQLDTSSLKPVVQHHERADRQRERSEHAARAAQPEDRLLDLGLVVLLDRPHERADAGRRKRPDGAPRRIQQKALGAAVTDGAALVRERATSPGPPTFGWR